MRTAQYPYFGWEVTFFELGDGEAYSVIIQRDIPLAKLSCKTFYTAGTVKATRKSGDYLLSDRPPGFFSGTGLPKIVERGTHILTAQGDCEWWCIDGTRPMNGGQAPELTPVVLQTGEEMQLAVGAKLLVCQGSAVIDGRKFNKFSSAEVVTQEKTLQATTGFFGLLFDRINTK